MSYLKYLVDVRPATDGRGNLLGNNARIFRLQWRSDIGNIIVNPIGRVILYKSNTKLGQRLRRNHESEQHFIERELRKLGGIWDHEYTFWSGY